MQSGERVADRYRLDSLLGRGGMGEVWRCHDLELGRDVAVKLLRESDADDETLRRFRREAAIGAQLRHPGITVVHDIGRHENRLFIVMELLVGQDLARVLADKPRGLRFVSAIDYAEQAAKALSATHAHGVVHRDLKPANLFRLTDRSLKICDFGIASSVQSSPIETRTGWMLGTPTYMAPEQWHGRDIDTPADMYALGCVLYALLTGAPPFRAGKEPLAVMQRHLNDTPAPMRSIRAEIPYKLESLVAALLAKDPEARPDARETADRLHQIGYGGPDLHAQPKARLEAPPPLRSEPAPVVVSDPPADATPALPGNTGPRPYRVPPGGVSRRGLLVGGAGVLVAATAMGVLGHEMASASNVKPKSAADSDAATSTDPRWHEFTLTGHTDTVNSVAFSPDGKTLASGSNDYYLRLWDLATRKSIAALKPYFGGDVLSVAFSPDGKTIATGGDLHDLQFWNVATRAAADSVFVGATVTNVAYSPDGKTLATGTADGYMVSLTATTFQPIVLWDAHTHARTALLDQGSDVSAMAFSPDGKTIAAGTESGLILLWDLATRKKTATLNGHADTVYSVAFSPDGKTLASTDLSAIMLWDVARRTGTKAFTGYNASGSVVFSPDGKTLVAGDDVGFTIWDIATRKQSVRFDVYQNVQSLAVSPDGRTVAGGCENGTIRVWKYVSASAAGSARSSGV